MKAITLWQPWATLIAIGAKRFETRGWATNYRGPLAIHAAKRPIQYVELNTHIYGALGEAGCRMPNRLPMGCVVCTVNLAAVYPAERAIELPFFGECERHFGDFTPGRFAWRLDNVQTIDNIPARGSRGFWEWDHAAVQP